MSLSSKLNLICEIIRTVKDCAHPLVHVVEQLSNRPAVLGSDVVALIPLARKFGFIEGDDNNLSITKQGLDFMNYVDSMEQEIINRTSPMEEDYETLDKKLKIIGGKYQDKKELKGVYDDIQEIRSTVAEHVASMPELVSDFELLLTASMPPGLGEKIPIWLKGQAIHHDEAIRKIIRDTTKELVISSPFIELSTFKMLIGNMNTERLNCKILTSDKERLKENSYNLSHLKSFLNSHFLNSEIRYLRKADVISHAKVWLSEKSVHITSANILTNSQTDNFEIGIYSNNTSLVNSCGTLINKVWDLSEIL